MVIEIKGRIVLDDGVKTYGAKGFKKRCLIVDTGDKYNAHFPLDLTQDDCDSNVSEGDAIEAECYLNGSNLINGNRAFLNLTIKTLRVTESQNQDSETSEEPSDGVPF